MTLMRAQVVSAWYRVTIIDADTGASHETNLLNGCRAPQIVADYALLRCEDVTSQPSANIIPKPSALTVEIVCEDAVLAQMDADDVPILWSEIING